MERFKSDQGDLIVGDLVYHLLYGKKWVALILALSAPDTIVGADVTLVHMHPGTEHEFFFRKTLVNYRLTDRLGYVSHHWLRLLREVAN